MAGVGGHDHDHRGGVGEGRVRGQAGAPSGDVALPLVGAWLVDDLDGPGDPPVPILVVDPRHRDIADLHRVLTTDGDGAARDAWRLAPGDGPDRDLVGLSVSVVSPVRTTLHVAFLAPDSRDVLDAAALSGRLGFTVGPDGTGSLVVVTLPNVGELRDILDRLDAGENSRRRGGEGRRMSRMAQDGAG